MIVTLNRSRCYRLHYTVHLLLVIFQMINVGDTLCLVLPLQDEIHRKLGKAYTYAHR